MRLSVYLRLTAGLLTPRASAAALAILVAALAWPRLLPAADPGFTIGPGAGSFVFVDRRGDPSKRMTVYTYLPAGTEAAAARIVFVMHGVSRNADGYRDAWIPAAERHGFLVIAPLFDREQWGPGGYSHRSAVSRDGQVREKALWSYSVIEHLFDALKEATGNRSRRYDIYGHSEGGQFVHRLVLLLPEARYARAVAANPGWYTMPSFGVGFPYGLKGSPATEASLKSSLGRDFVLMLGERDTDPDHAQLRRTPEAMAQGANRFERGQKYFEEARTRASEMKSDFRWKLEVVPGSAHDNSKMSRAAAAVLVQ
jgi:poly(3-hydroxybutyrate) depolymerase